MSAIFYSDVYRLRKGAAVRNTVIGLLVTILVVGISMYFATSDGFVIMLDQMGSALDAAGQEDLVREYEEVLQTGITPDNGIGFAREILAQNILPFFFLPLFVAIFCADFSAGTFRNTLSYESDRKKIYLSKLLLSAVMCVGLNLITLAAGWLLGGVMYGFGGATLREFVQLLVLIILLLPMQMATIGFGHCLVAFTKKCSATIAVYLITLSVLSIVLQTLSMVSSLSWLALLDWNSAGALMARYWEAPPASILFSLAMGVAITAVTTVAGMACYCKTDMV